MTKAQDAFYWRLWRQVCQVQGWPMSDSSARHQVHHEALGHDKSHKQFTNADFDRVVVEFKLLINPEDVAASVAKADPDRMRAKRTEHRLRELPPRLVARLCYDKHGHSAFGDLSSEDQRELIMSAERVLDRRGKPAAADKPKEPKPRAVRPENQPF